ncbi:MAG: peptide-methionine (R)-S-oxide reductase MsrB [Candidatus Paceibacterota bacterium]
MKKNQNNLSPRSRDVTQNTATEPPFSGALLKEDRDGMYHCIVCNEELFSADSKFDSGSGWPSFHTAVDDEKITLETDTSLGMERTEVRCVNCDAHLGHVFNDGPERRADGKPASGKRFCINSCALDFSPETDN